MSESSSFNIQTLNSRFKLLDRPVAIPGKCVVCGAVDRPVVDTTWSIDYYGVVYFCVFCLAEVAGVIGMIDSRLLEAAEMNSARQFEEYLRINGLKVIKNEQYISWVSSISQLHADITDYSGDFDVQDDIKPTQSESATDENVSRVIEQEFDFAFDEGPISVSASSSDGDKLFNI